MDREDFWFDTEFMTDDEVEEMLDSLVTTTAEQAAEEDRQTAMVNPYKIQQIGYTYKVLKYLTKNLQGVVVTYELHEPYKSMGSVSVIGKRIDIRKPEWFMKCVELSNNFDAHAKTDGTVQMDFTFHGLTIPVEYEEGEK